MEAFDRLSCPRSADIALTLNLNLILEARNSQESSQTSPEFRKPLEWVSMQALHVPASVMQLSWLPLQGVRPMGSQSLSTWHKFIQTLATCT